MNRGELAARLLVTFLGELEEQVATMNTELLVLEAAPRDPAPVQSLFRIAHTLKGAARAADVPLVEHVCHELETLLAQARDGTLSFGPEEFALLFSAADALADAGQRMKAGHDLGDSALARLRASLKGIQPARAGAVAVRPLPAGVRPRAPQPSVVRTAAPSPGGPAAVGRGDGHVRVQGEMLDAVLASTGQLVIAGSRVARRPAELAALRDFATSWASEWGRTGRRLSRALERSGAPAAVTQSVSRVDENLRRIIHDTSRLAASAAEDARTLAQVTGEVSDRVRRLRMRPFAEACEALPRAARDVALAGGKEVRFEIAGGDVQADRAVLDGLREALLHLVRNAVDHGIEPASAREQAGKPRAGVVSVAAAMRGDRIVVTVTDDGAGLDVGAIRTQLARHGIAVPTADRDVVDSLFAGGVSTRTETTAISGRGVGLDLVRAAVARIRGRLDLTWAVGGGTTFVIECPPTLATIRALLVAVGPQTVAVPTIHVARLLRVTVDAIKHVEGRAVITTADGPVPLVSLARLLPPLVERPVAGTIPVVLLMVGQHRVAVVVDDLIAEEEIVLRPLSGGVKSLPCVSGATLLGTGRVALVVDAAALVATALGAGAGASLAFAKTTPDGLARQRVLVVDDSITTRTLEQSILEAAGYDVVTAVDGAAGWKMLQEAGADLVVADVEMPRMDGLALCEAIRGSKRFKALPVVLVTALETAEDRARGLDVGADAYLAKSSFDQQNLLDTVGQLLA